jgi:sec-independent protein translocase protein TatA
MFGFDLGGPEAIIILVIVLVLFGGSQIPKLAKNLGRAQREFKDGIEEASKPQKATDTTATEATSTGSASTGGSSDSTS